MASFFKVLFKCIIGIFTGIGVVEVFKKLKAKWIQYKSNDEEVYTYKQTPTSREIEYRPND